MSASLQSLVNKLTNQFLSGKSATVAEVVMMMEVEMTTAVMEEVRTLSMVEKWFLGIMITMGVWILKETLFFFHRVYLLQQQGNRMNVSLSVASGWGLSLGTI